MYVRLNFLTFLICYLLGWFKHLQMLTCRVGANTSRCLPEGWNKHFQMFTWGLEQTPPDVYLRFGANTSRCLPEGWNKHLLVFTWGLEQTSPDVYLRFGENISRCLPEGWCKHLQVFTWGLVQTSPGWPPQRSNWPFMMKSSPNLSEVKVGFRKSVLSLLR